MKCQNPATEEEFFIQETSLQELKETYQSLKDYQPTWPILQKKVNLFLNFPKN